MCERGARAATKSDHSFTLIGIASTYFWVLVLHLHHSQCHTHTSAPHTHTLAIHFILCSWCVLMFARRSLFLVGADAAAATSAVRNVYLNLVTASQSHFALFLMFWSCAGTRHQHQSCWKCEREREREKERKSESKKRKKANSREFGEIRNLATNLKKGRRQFSIWYIFFFLFGAPLLFQLGAVISIRKSVPFYVFFLFLVVFLVSIFKWTYTRTKSTATKISHTIICWRMCRVSGFWGFSGFSLLFFSLPISFHSCLWIWFWFRSECRRHQRRRRGRLQSANASTQYFFLYFYRTMHTHTHIHSNSNSI